MVCRGSSRVKRESAFANGLITPDESMTSTGTVYLKEEESAPSSFSDQLQAKLEGASFSSCRGLPSEGDTFANETFESEAAERHRRSASVSLRSSYPPPPPPPQPQPRTQTSRKNPMAVPAAMSSTLAEKGKGLETVGHDVRWLIDLLDELRKIGLEGIVDHLPELVIVGDQSAGKSSLMSGIAEINLPTGADMCTQCPTNIKTASGEVWECKVSLQEQYTFVPGPFIWDKDGGQEFPNWEPKTDGVETRLFKTINDETELENVLKWAQKALLNPSQDYESFAPDTDLWYEQRRLRDGDPSYKEEAPFSPNVILVQITAPGLPALSFFDLPGLFYKSKKNDQKYLVKAFEALARKYIKHENALVICAISMANDPGLSGTQAVIDDCNAENRCIGVLTKPDVLGSTGYPSVLSGETFVLRHGYFVARRPDKDAVHLRGKKDYHALARDEEEEFFDTNPMWKEGGVWAKYRDRCGTFTIQKYLSREFAKLILHSIPDLERKIKEQAADVENHLSRLPEVSDDRAEEAVRQALFEFSSAVRSLLDGGLDFQSTRSNSFHSGWTRLCHQFQKATEYMRPGCKITHPSDDQREVIEIADDSDEERTAAPARSIQKGKRPLENGQPADRPVKFARISPSPGPVKLEEGPFAFVTPKVRNRNKGFPKTSAAFRNIKPEEMGPFYKEYLDSGHAAMSIADIQQSIQSNVRAGRPGHVNEKVKEDFALMSIVPWRHPLQDFLGSFFKMLREQIHAVLSDVLDNYKDTALYRRSKPIIDNFLLEVEEKQRDKSFRLYNIEKSALFTINNHAFDLNYNEALAHLKASRRKIRLNAHLDQMYRSYNGKSTLEAFKADQRDKVKDIDMPGRDFRKELEVAAYIRGYYNTARLRFTDSVCADMNSVLFRDIKEGFKWLLPRALGLDAKEGGESKCQELLHGNAEVRKKRGLLKMNKIKLEKVKGVLTRFRSGMELGETSLNIVNDDSHSSTVAGDGRRR